MAEIFNAATRVLTSPMLNDLDQIIEAKFSQILKLAREIQVHLEVLPVL